MTGYTHGTRSRYVLGCRCQDCSAVAARYAKIHYWKHRMLRKVSSQSVREHILFLNSYGLGVNAIADSCGVGAATVRLIRLGRKPRIYPRTEQRIFSVTPEGIADGALVDASFTQNLLRELLDEGWTGSEINQSLGRKGSCLPMLYRQHVKASTQAKVERLYRRAMLNGRNAIPIVDERAS